MCGCVCVWGSVCACAHACVRLKIRGSKERARVCVTFLAFCSSRAAAAVFCSTSHETHTFQRGGVAGADPPMMLEEVMMQQWLCLRKHSEKGWWPMMSEEGDL